MSAKRLIGETTVNLLSKAGWLMHIIKREHEVQWNPVNGVTNEPKKFGHNNKVTILTGVSLQKNVMTPEAKKSGRNNEVTILPRWL